MKAALRCRSGIASRRGTCDHASEMLAEYLLACGFGDWACAVRSPAHGQGHTWLERGDWIVDITADQFSGRASYGRVGPAIVMRDRTWHERHFPHSRRQKRLGVDVMFGAVLDRARADYTILSSRTNSLRERWPATQDPSACQP